MIGIQLEGYDEFLETMPDTSIDLTLENPLFGENKLSPGSYSFPFTLPAGTRSPRNAAKLKHPDVVENNEAYQLQKARLFFNGIPFRRGTGNLKTNTSDKGRASAYFTFGLSTLDHALKTAKLRDVVSAPVNISTEALDKTLYIKKTVDPTVDWDITVNGTNYTGTPEGVVAAINNNGVLTVDTGKHVPRAILEAGVNSPSGALAPAYIKILLVTYVTSFDPITETWIPLPVASGDPLQELSLSTSDPDLYLIEAWDMDTYYDQFDAWLANFPSNILVFPVRFNATPYGDNSNIKITETVNGVNASGIIRNYAGGLNTKVINRNSLQPFMRLKFALDKIAERFNFSWEGDFYDHGELDSIIIDNTSGLDAPQAWIEGETLVFWKRKFNLSDLVPDITVVDFLSRLKSRYNLGIYYNDLTDKVRICFKEPIAKRNTYEDVTVYSSPMDDIGDLRVAGFNILVPKEDSDAFSVSESMDIGDPQEPIEVGCGRLHQSISTVISGGLVNGVRVATRFGDKFGFRIFHYDGIVNNGTYSYQACSISSPAFYEPLMTEGASLGIHDAFWKYWLTFKRNRRMVKLKASFPFRMLRSIDWELKRRFDRNNYLIKSIRVRITNQKVSVSDVELYTMK